MDKWTEFVFVMGLLAIVGIQANIFSSITKMQRDLHKWYTEWHMLRDQDGTSQLANGCDD